LETTIGNTPLLPLNRISRHLPPHIEVYAKAEWFNPGGSIKDRPAYSILNKAIADGLLTSNKRFLDSTSGNMGIAYATFGARLDIPITLTIPANASQERLSILHALGAELILTDPLEGSDGAIISARELAQSHPETYYYGNQYDNPANWKSHYYSTGPEILQQTNNQITHFVAGMGTSGTITGVGRYLKEYHPSVKIIACQPDSAFHGLEGLKHIATSIKPQIYQPDLVDRVIEIPTEEAYVMMRRLTIEEGLFVGISSGAAAAAVLKVAEEIEHGVIVTVFPDAGYKYLSEESLWE
jgi:cysteine synthase B